MASNLSESETPKSIVSWLPMVLSTIIIIGLILFISKGCNGSDNSQEFVTTGSPRMDSIAASPSMPMHELSKVKLQDGVELNIYKGGIEDQLVKYLDDPAS